MSERIYADYNGPWPDDSGAPGCHLTGWMSPRELDWLYTRASEADSCVEIGSFKGRSTFAILSGCKGTVWAIDPWNEDPIYPSRPDLAEHRYPSAYPEFVENVGHFKNLVIVKGYSPAVLDDIEIPAVDFTFVDGCHDYPAVIADIDAWLPRTRKILAGHDFLHSGYPGVTQAVEERFGRRYGIVESTGIWFVNLA